jgi:ribosome-associated translation inhibitor RaiA
MTATPSTISVRLDVSQELLVLRVLADHEGRIQRLEAKMADITQAEADLAAQVDATLTEITALEGQVTTLQAAVAAGDPAAIQSAADAIEAQVTRLKGAATTPPATPAPATPPAAP